MTWQCDAHNRSMHDAVHEFARTHWQEPRRARAIDPDGRFRLVGGRNTYRIVLDRLHNLYVITIDA